MTNAARTGQSGQAGTNSSGPQGGKTTFIEDDTEFKGTLSSKCPVVVKGSLEGEVVGPSLYVSPSGRVAGKVKVSELQSEGVLAGEIDADSVQLAGTVKSDTVIRARSLEVRLGPPQGGKLQVTFGRCELAVGEVPSKEEAVSAAAAPLAPAVRAGGTPPTDEAPTQLREAERAERATPAAESDAAGSAQRARQRRENPSAPTGA